MKTFKGDIKYDPNKTFEEQDITVCDIIDFDDYGRRCPIHDPIICRDDEGYCLCNEWGKCPEEKVEEALGFIG